MTWTSWPKTTQAKRISCLLMLTALVLLVTACGATLQTTSSATVPPPSLAPLPESARQTAPPSICSPSCSAALTSERESWRSLLTTIDAEAASAKPDTTQPTR